MLSVVPLSVKVTTVGCNMKKNMGYCFFYNSTKYNFMPTVYERGIFSEDHLLLWAVTDANSNSFHRIKPLASCLASFHLLHAQVPESSF